MQEVIALIQNHKQDFAQLPLFNFMQDKTIDPRQRLSFAPCMAHFIMSFSDLNKYIFRDNKSKNELQKIINEHSNEDSKHWSWYITDLDKLGFNQDGNFTQALKFLWSEETKITRQISYQVSAYTWQADPIIKVAAIESLEAMGHVFFSMSLPIAVELQKMTKKEYVYFGNVHLQVETGHTMGTPEVEDFITDIELTNAQRQEAFDVVEKTFKIFSEWTYELLAYARAQKIEPVLSR
ncbi:hypothetical protein NUACC21_59820 [Scytonema sp. NUACC21]